MSDTKTNVSIERISETRVQIHVTVPQNKVQTTFTEALTALNNEIQLPGFRKGKVPHDVIERKFADDIKSNVLQKLISQELDTLFALDKDQKEAPPVPISKPVLVETPKLEKTTALDFLIAYDIIPEFELPELKSISAEAAEIAVNDADIKDELHRLQEQNADIKVKEDETVSAGDLVTLNYSEIDSAGKEVESSRRTGFTCTVGSDTLGLGDALLGMKKDKTTVCNISADQSEKTAQVTVTKISERLLPSLDDEFAQDINEEFETLDDLKQSLKKKQETQIKEMQKSYFVSKVFEQLDASVHTALPESLREHEFSKLSEQYIRKHFPADSQEASDNPQITPKELHEILDADVEKSVKNQLVLSKLIEQYTLQVSDEEVVSEISTLSRNEKPDPELIEQYKQYGLYERLRSSLLERKLHELVVTEASVSTTKSFASQEAFLNETAKKPKHTNRKE